MPTLMEVTEDVCIGGNTGTRAELAVVLLAPLASRCHRCYRRNREPGRCSHVSLSAVRSLSRLIRNFEVRSAGAMGA